MSNVDIDYSGLSIEDIYEILGEIEQHHNVVVTLWTKTDYIIQVKTLMECTDVVAEGIADATWTPELRNEISDAMNKLDTINDIVLSSIKTFVAQSVGLQTFVDALKNADMKTTESA